MQQARTGLPKSSDLVTRGREKAQVWIKSNQAKALRLSHLSNLAASDAVVRYFADWRAHTMSIDEIAQYVLVDYFGAGTADGNALRNDLVSPIVRIHLGDKCLHESDKLLKANQLRSNHPGAFSWLPQLAYQHARICQETLLEAFGGSSQSRV
ncbi:hypothetical protein F8O01_14360 [Pseudoclavibacter chungangensis]|uniref:Uncharacterized protein n=1 Tax=Pseudoclavibacter chungangensis TaxID=587635 RepID=A0A7J5BNU2_9MICO|nr:hypothetical protein [Pseudoclavibacter chungangensis]KAB1654092.1 hypothetical protein F8O01_14360 [Pseudoclavibacter chungangensis]NYJ65992.1 hypothetical protein [Pseudoclavibacter chungangensis]